MSAHVTHAMELRAFFDRNDWSPNIADKNARLKDVNLLSGNDTAVDLSAIHEDAGGHYALDYAVLSND